VKKLIILLILFIPTVAFSEPSFYVTAEGRQSIFEEQEFLEEKGPMLETKLDDSFSYRVGAGAYFGKNFDVGIFYSRLRSESSDKYNYKDTYYNFNLDDDIDVRVDALGNSDYENENFDLEIGYTLKAGDTDIRLMAGIRHASYKQDIENHFLQTEDRDHLFSQEYDEIYTTEKAGIGPRLGLAITHPLGFAGLSVTGAVNWAVIFTKQDTINTLDNTTIEQFPILPAPKTHNDPHSHGNRVFNSDLVDDFFREDTTVYNFDIEAGLQYDLKLSEGLTLVTTFGYKYGVDYNVIDEVCTSTQTVDTQYEFDKNNINHGVFLRTKLNF